MLEDNSHFWCSINHYRWFPLNTEGHVLRQSNERSWDYGCVGKIDSKENAMSGQVNVQY